MIGIDTIVWFVFTAIVLIGVLALLWWLIGFCESKLPMLARNRRKRRCHNY